MSDDPITLDEHRGMAAQKATEIRRRLTEVEANQLALQNRAEELEKYLAAAPALSWPERSEEHTSELQSLMRISYAVFCLKKKKTNRATTQSKVSSTCKTT